MPRTLLKLIPVVIGLSSFGLGVIGGVYAAGQRMGHIETRIDVLEICSQDITVTTQEHDERLRQVENAVATIPIMATDIREMRGQLTQMLNLLVERGN